MKLMNKAILPMDDCVYKSTYVKGDTVLILSEDKFYTVDEVKGDTLVVRDTKGNKVTVNCNDTMKFCKLKIGNNITTGRCRINCK